MLPSTLIISTARSWIGTPFHHQGRLKGVGVDCIGLIVGVAAELGIVTPDQTGYARTPSAGLLRLALDRALTAAPDLAPSRIVLMRWESEDMHVGLLADSPYGGLSLIHAYAKARRVAEHRLDVEWSNRIAMVYHFPEPRA